MPAQKLTLDDPQEVPVEACVDNQDENLGYTVPVFVDLNKTIMDLIRKLKVNAWGQTVLLTFGSRAELYEPE